MSAAEYEDILATGQFRSVGNCLEGKWFAERREDALTWSRLFAYPAGSYIVAIELPDAIAAKLHHNTFLDGIGPAKYAQLEQLSTATILFAQDVTLL